MSLLKTYIQVCWIYFYQEHSANIVWIQHSKKTMSKYIFILCKAWFSQITSEQFCLILTWKCIPKSLDFTFITNWLIFMLKLFQVCWDPKIYLRVYVLIAIQISFVFITLIYSGLHVPCGLNMAKWSLFWLHNQHC